MAGRRQRPEHSQVRLPLIDQLIALGWGESQIQWQPEWRVPKTPSDASKREANQSFASWPVDVAIFDEPRNRGRWEHVKIIIETKAPDIETGLSQLETYLSLEPRAVLGLWTNGSQIIRLYRQADGSFAREDNAALPAISENLLRRGRRLLTWTDLQIPTVAKKLKQSFEYLLNKIVSIETQSTRRDEQLNQFCNLLLVKLESDKRGEIAPTEPLVFQVRDDENSTAAEVKRLYNVMKQAEPRLFSAPSDSVINLNDQTIAQVCYTLSRIRLLEVSIEALSQAFQVFRSAALKSEEGQYFTPFPVIKSAVQAMDIDWEDKIIDPACGTGGFLVECYQYMASKYPHLSQTRIKDWVQRKIYGIDKDYINVKLTKSMMLILGDGSSQIHIGDSLREHIWIRNYPALPAVLADETFTCIITNPPFGKNLRMMADDVRQSGYTIALKPEKQDDGTFTFSQQEYDSPFA
jgi:type I restriction enzyme M protein